jgi:hypothetical protein
MEHEMIVESFLNAIENNDFATAESFVSNNFNVIGVKPEPLTVKEFLGVHRAFGQGMPDFKFNYKIGSVSKNIVETKIKLTGTHLKEMPAPIPGLHNIPATNKTVNMPEEKARFTIKENKIESMHIETVQGGGLHGVLKQLGVEIPTEVHH